MKKLALILLSILLAACSSQNDVSKVNNGTLKETVQWEDNSKKIEELKREKLTAYPDKSIGEGMTSLTIEEWKYGNSEKEQYLFCQFQEEKKKESIIFYKDSYDNVNVAEYYVDNTKQTKEKIEEFEKKYFVKEETKKQNETSTKETSTKKETTENKSTSVKGKFSANFMPEDGEYYNSAEGGVPYMCKIKIKKTSPNSFKFSIWQVTDKNGNNCNKMIFKEHEAIFEKQESKSAVYKGNQYTLYFYCDFYYSFGLSGFALAEKCGNIYSTAGSENFGI